MSSSRSTTKAATRRSWRRTPPAIATGLGAQLIALETPNAGLNGTNLGRQWDGAIYVATPQLLRAFGIKSSEIDPNADILSSRPGLSGVSGIHLGYGGEGRRQWPRRDHIELYGGDGLSRQPGHPGDRGAAERDLGAEHGDHRARDARVPHHGEHHGLVGSGNSGLSRHRRSAAQSSPRRRRSSRSNRRTTSRPRSL